MTGTQHAWVWATLQEMAALAAERDEIAKEAKRLADAYADAHGRVRAAVPDLAIEETVSTLRLIGSPPSAAPAGGEAPAAASKTDSPDPLAIPEYLRRGDGPNQEENEHGPTQADEVA